MSERGAAAADVLRRIVQWATAQPDIRRVLLVGSRARHAEPDDLADIDVQIYAEATARYTGDDDDGWLRTIGRAAACVRDQYMDGGVHVLTRLVIFEDGVKVDFAFYPAAAISHGIRSGLPYRTLVEKDPATAPPPHTMTSGGHTTPPDEAEFRRVVEEFWFEAYHVAKYLARGELYLAKSRDWATKQFLVVMAGWHERFVHRRMVDADDEGKRASMSGETWQSLCDTFASGDRDETWQAMLRTMTLFRRLAGETAAVLGVDYPENVDTRLSALIESMR